LAPKPDTTDKSGNKAETNLKAAQPDEILHKAEGKRDADAVRAGADNETAALARTIAEDKARRAVEARRKALAAEYARKEAESKRNPEAAEQARKGAEDK